MMTHIITAHNGGWVGSTACSGTVYDSHAAFQAVAVGAKKRKKAFHRPGPSRPMLPDCLKVSLDEGGQSGPRKRHRIRYRSLRFFVAEGDGAIIGGTMFCCDKVSETGAIFRRIDGSGCEVFVSSAGMASLVSKNQIARIRQHFRSGSRETVRTLPHWVEKIMRLNLALPAAWD